MATNNKKINRKEQTFSCICIQCNIHFKHNFLSTFCTPDCKLIYNKTHETKNVGATNCIHCGIAFSKRNNNAAQKFCTRTCYWEYRRKHPDEKIQSNQHKSSKIEKTCKYCSSVFLVHPYRKNAEFCTKQCHYSYRRQLKTCKSCGIDFYTPNHKDADYCGNNCAAKGNGKRQSKLSTTVSRILDSNNIKYITENPIKSNERTVWVDFMIDDKIAIECNGDYWHCNPDIYSSEYYHTQIKKTAEQIWKYDDERKKYIEVNGYFCIIIWESDLFDNTFPDRLIKTLKEII